MEHVAEWLSAYADGELQGEKLARVEAHLRTCPACQGELEQLGGLSSLLHQIPPMQPRTTPEGFNEAIRKRLGSPAGRLTRQKALRAGWWAVPLGLIGLWAFALAVVIVSSVLQEAGLLEGISFALPLHNYSFPMLLRWLTASLWGWTSTPSAWLDLTGALAEAFGVGFAIHAGLALLLGCWLVTWWASNPDRRLVKIKEKKWTTLRY
jgi:hypothetical protein